MTASLTAMSTLLTVGADVLHSDADPRVFSAWDKATPAGLILVGSSHLLDSTRLAARSAPRSRREPAAFAAGWLALAAAVVPWFDAAAIERFGAHGAARTGDLVAAPLLMVGRPMSTILQS
jgi:cytochrome c oxidase assembly factor CtaG